MDQSRVEAFLGQFVTDAGATGAAGLVVIGHRLGLYGSLAEGPATPEQFAERTGCARRYLTEWLRGQAAGGYVTYDPATGEFFLTEEQAFCLADPNGPNLPAAFLVGVGYLKAEAKLTEAFRTGDGIGWHEHDDDVFVGVDAFYRPGYVAELVSSWIPALDGVEEKLTAGGRVADVGCGLGSTSVLMAQAFPRTTVVGSDYHAESIGLARKQAAEAGVGDRVDFEVSTAQTFTGSGYDLVTMFDCLHDMGDPLGAARHVRETLAPDGTWLLVEPYAADRVEDTLNPVGRLYYAGSLFLCTPNALSQDGGYALGAQAGEAPVRRLAEEAGFTRFQRVAQTPFNVVYEIRRLPPLDEQLRPGGRTPEDAVPSFSAEGPPRPPTNRRSTT
jgi:SAM-dependent methyltransferase